MIRRKKNGGWILITQHDHAELSGQIMTHWGNSEFARPNPYDEVLFAVREHDSGWKEWDSLPKINPDTGYPANFTEMSFQDQDDIWRKCYKPYSQDQPYASCLVALHFSKFSRNNLRKDPGNQVAESLHRELKEFVANGLNLQISNGNIEEIPSEIIKNLKLLQIGDIISLALCHGWKSIEITEVPYDYNGSETTLQIKSEDGFNYTVTPYPFDEPALKFSIQVRSLHSKTFSGDEELREMLSASRYENLDFTIRKG